MGKTIHADTKGYREKQAINYYFQAQNKNLKKSLEKVKCDHNTLKNRASTQENKFQEVTTQLQVSIQERIALEKAVIDISTKV